MDRIAEHIFNKNKMNRFIANKTKDCGYYREISIKDLEQPITILLGPNGTGKSRSLVNMEYEIKKNDKLASVLYSTSDDDIVKSVGSPFIPGGGFENLIYNWKSEGERMIGSFES